MSSYVTYTVATRTNMTMFRKQEMSVNRRFSDFLGLHDKLSEKYLQNGRVIPPAPDKSVAGMAKVKMGKEASGGTEAVAPAGGDQGMPDEVGDHIQSCDPKLKTSDCSFWTVVATRWSAS